MGEKRVRIIPRLDIKGPNLVKGIHLEGLRVLGKPEYYARHYYEMGADELYYQDIVASLYGRNSLSDIITKTAKEIFIPLTVGGGIRSVSDITTVLRAGADKVAINTGAISRLEFINEAAEIFGSSTIVVAIEAIRQGDGNYYAFTDNGRESTNMEVVEWAKKAEELGAGEIIITSVDREGTGTGFDIALIESVANAVSLPIVAHGGPGKLEHLSKLLKTVRVDGLCVASMLHYDVLKNQQIDFDEGAEGNYDFLKKKEKPKNINCEGIPSIKQFLHENNVLVRL